MPLSKIKQEPISPFSKIKKEPISPFANVKQEPMSPLISGNITDDIKIKSSSSSKNTPNRGAEALSQSEQSSDIDRLQEAADKITLMSPEVFNTAPKSSPPVPHQNVTIKQEPQSPSDNSANNSVIIASPQGVTSNISGGVTSNISVPIRQFINLASGGSSPSREVQDILAESEEQGK